MSYLFVHEIPLLPASMKEFRSQSNRHGGILVQRSQQPAIKAHFSSAESHEAVDTGKCYQSFARQQPNLQRSP